MGKWKKAVAALAAVPMLMALAPAANAVESDPTDSSAAQRALAAALKSNAKAAADSDLLASLDFDNVAAGATGTIVDDTTGTKATINGAAAVATSKDGTAAVRLGSGFWLNVTKSDDSAVLKGLDAVTISYDSKSASTNQGWSVFAAPNTNAQTYQQERYLGVMDRTTSVNVERYNNAGKRDTTGNVSKDGLASQWRHVDLVIDKAASTLYIDGEQAATVAPADGASFAQLTDILGADGGVLQIGKANWVNGEYYTGALDNLKIYGSAHTADQIKEAYDSTKSDAAKADANALTINNGSTDVYSNITLPAKGSVNGSAITWKSSNAKVITDAADGDIAAGVVARQKTDTKVTLTATITDADGNTETKEFELTVKAAVEQPKTTDYLFAHFTGTEGSATDEQMYFATSKDGLSWHDTRESGDPVLSWNNSQTGNSRGKDNGVRDPYLVRSPEGDTVYLIATELSIHNRGGWGAATATTNGSTNLIVWESHDFVNWSEPRAVDVASQIPGAGMAWAPEAYWDDVNKQYMVYWATASDADNKSGDRTNMYYSTTRDFVNFTTPVKWIDRVKSVIDTTMIKADDGYYYRVSGDTYLGVERSKDPYATTLTTGDTIANGYYNTDSDPNQWTLVGTFGDLTGTGLTGAQLEGPELFFYNEDDVQTSDAGKKMLYGLMWDQYSAGKGYTPYRSADLGSTDKADWGFASDVNFGSLKKRHGTILPVTETEYNAILKAFDKNKDTEPVTPDEDGSGPIAEYDFEDSKGTDTTENSNDLTFNGNAKVSEDAEKGKVLKLDGSDGTYAEFPKGLFDGRNKLTVQMDVKSEINKNQFTFAFGQNSTKYYFLKYNNSGELASRITTNSYGAEDAANATLSGNGAWHRVTVTLDDNVMTVYSDGAQVAQNKATKNKVTDLGNDLLAYLGKSFYNDPYFKGSFDNVNVWNRALTAQEVEKTSPIALQGISVGTVPSDPNSLRGTDDHSQVRSTLDWSTKTVTTVLNRRGGATKVPVKVSVNRSDDSIKLTLDGQAFTNGGTADLAKDRTLVVDLGDGAPQTWTLKKVTVGNNPVLPGQYADPDIDYFDGKFWIYPTTDGFSGWSGNYFHAFSSTDLVNWTDEGVILDVNKDHQPTTDGDENTAISPWSVGSAWAPTIEKKNGKYYFYYCAKLPNGTSAIGVAVADNPAGPYKAADQPLVTRTMEGVTVGQAIDPSIFTDPNTGKSYILYGNGSPAIAELNDDMVSIKAGTVKKLNGLNGFRESVVVAYRDGKYHWTWSCDDANSPNYHVRYGVSDSIDGTITYKGVLLQKDSSKNLQGTAHQSDVHVTDADGNDRWLMAYHRHYTPLGVFTSGLGYHRETAIDEITFDADGLMQTIHPTDEGVSIEMADTTALDGAIEAADKLGTDGSAYTEASWKAFEDALAAAKTAKQTFLDSGLSQADVDAAAKALTDAQNALEESQPEPEHPAAGTILSIAVTAQPAKAEYKVGEALDVAGLVVTATVADGNGGSTTRELAADEYELLGFDSSKASDKVTVTVQSVADSTKTATFTVKVVADETPTPDPDLATEEELKQLEDAIAKAEAEKLNQDDYTADSWKAYANALAQAKKVLAKENATSTEVQDAIRHLTEARKALVKVSADGKKPGAVISDTGVAVFGVAGAVVVLAAAGIALTIWRKRRI